MKYYRKGFWCLEKKIPLFKAGLANSPQKPVFIIVAFAFLYNISLKLRLHNVEDSDNEEFNDSIRDNNINKYYNIDSL